MALFLEVHKVGGAGAEEIARAHAADLLRLARLGISYRRHWFSRSSGRVCCLVEAPDAEALRAAQGDVPELVTREITGLLDEGLSAD